jgi:hypothetical protein
MMWMNASWQENRPWRPVSRYPSSQPSHRSHRGSNRNRHASVTGAAALAQGVFRGVIQDQTGGATHFFAPAAQASLGRSVPGWAGSEREQSR